MFWWKKKKEKREERTSIQTSVNVVSHEPFVVGFLSGKGGCGKSVISANTVVLLSALYGSVIAVDLDITNSTLTSMLFYVEQATLTDDNGVSLIDYIVVPPKEHKLYKLEFPPDKRYNIQVAGNPGLGVPSRNIYILPAKKNVPSYGRNLMSLSRLNDNDVKTSLNDLYLGFMNFAHRNKIPFIIFDFPPLRPDQRSVFEGVFLLLEQIPQFILISPFDPSALHGLVNIISSRYSYIKSRTLAFFINMAIPQHPWEKEMEKYIKNVYGDTPVFFIQSDPRWRTTLLPPITIGDPSEGATKDLIKAYTKLNIIDKAKIKKYLSFDPEKEVSN
jgi:hypothetical protein